MQENWGWLAVATVVLAASTAADTPANCSDRDIWGHWMLYESRSTQDSSESCDSLGTVVNKLKVDLQPPDVVVDQYGNRGFWTLVYNQGFEVTVNGRTYFAFSYFEKHGQNVTSFCDRTFPGWSHDVTVRHWACFYGRKISDQRVKSHLDPFFYMQGGATVSREELRSVVERVNSAHTSWHAQLHRPFLGLTNADVLRLRGGPWSWLGQRPWVTQASPEVLLASESLPSSWDWRDVAGANFVSPVRDQGSCGSCYAFSSTGLLESRLRVQTNNSVRVTLSPQDIVSCSLLSQGCDGGFPYLVAGHYARDYGAALESCSPYRGQDAACPRHRCDRHYAASYRYVGGYYGACNEQQMMLALMRGPLAVSFEVYPDFMMYKTGVYQHNSSFHEALMRDQFVVVNHAVLVVGYGVDSVSGLKFWTVKNSWGERWGERGYFRILRGNDECGIESIAVEAVPIP